MQRSVDVSKTSAFMLPFILPRTFPDVWEYESLHPRLVYLLWQTCGSHLSDLASRLSLFYFPSRSMDSSYEAVSRRACGATSCRAFFLSYWLAGVPSKSNWRSLRCTLHRLDMRTQSTQTNISSVNKQRKRFLHIEQHPREFYWPESLRWELLSKNCETLKCFGGKNTLFISGNPRQWEESMMGGFSRIYLPPLTPYTAPSLMDRHLHFFLLETYINYNLTMFLVGGKQDIVRYFLDHMYFSYLPD